MLLVVATHIGIEDTVLHNKFTDRLGHTSRATWTTSCRCRAVRPSRQQRKCKGHHQADKTAAVGPLQLYDQLVVLSGMELVVSSVGSEGLNRCWKPLRRSETWS
jgi:hypothetical protein